MILFCFTAGTSFRTRHHLCRQRVSRASTRQFRSQGPVSAQAHRTEGSTGSEGQEGANEVGGGIGVGGGNGDGNEVGGGDGDVNGHGDGDGAGAGTGTGVETHRRTPDGNGGGDGDGSEDSSGDGNGDEDKGSGNEGMIGEGERKAKKHKKPQNIYRRQVGNGGDLGGKRKKIYKRKGWSSSRQLR